MKSTGLVFAEKPSIGVEPTRLPDRSRWGNHGTHTNITMVRLPSGLWIREFDGDDYATIASSPSTNVINNLTVLAWMKAATALSGANALVSKWNFGADKRAWLIGVGDSWAGDPFTVFVAEDGAGIVSKQYDGSIDVCDSVFHLVGFTWSVGTLKLYSDGAEDGSVTKTTDDAMTAILSEENVIGVGSSDVGATPGHLLTGQMSLPKIYNYALSAGQIKKIFESERHWFGV